MKPSLIHVCSACNPDRARKAVSGTPAQCRDTLNGTPLNDGETRIRYDIEAESALLTLFLAGVSVGCVMMVGLLKILGAR